MTEKLFVTLDRPGRLPAGAAVVRHGPAYNFATAEFGVVVEYTLPPPTISLSVVSAGKAKR